MNKINKVDGPIIIHILSIILINSFNYILMYAITLRTEYENSEFIIWNN